MKLSIKIFLPILATSILLLFWNNLDSKKTKTILQGNIKLFKKHPKFNSYWYQGKAEITSYKLTQNRYGELQGY